MPSLVGRVRFYGKCRRRVNGAQFCGIAQFERRDGVRHFRERPRTLSGTGADAMINDNRNLDHLYLKCRIFDFRHLKKSTDGVENPAQALRSWPSRQGRPCLPFAANEHGGSVMCDVMKGFVCGGQAVASLFSEWPMESSGVP